MVANGLPNGSSASSGSILPPLHPRAPLPDGFAKADFPQPSTSKPVRHWGQDHDCSCALGYGSMHAPIGQVSISWPRSRSTEALCMWMSQALAYAEPLEQATARHARAWKARMTSR